MIEKEEPFPPAQQAQQEPEPEIVQPRARTSNADLLKLIIESGEHAKGYAQQVVEAELIRDAFDQDWRMAKTFAMSQKFVDLQGSSSAAVATAMAKIQLGRSWGIGAADAMRFIYFTNGKPAVETELFAAKLMAAGYSWDVAYDRDEKGRCIGATIFPKLNGKTMTMRQRAPKTDAIGGWMDVPLEVSFTKMDADAALIWEKGKQIPLSQKWNFQSWPEDMYYWRALSRFRRRHAANVMNGAMSRDEAGEIEPSGEVARPLFGKGDAA